MVVLVVLSFGAFQHGSELAKLGQREQKQPDRSISCNVNNNRERGPKQHKKKAKRSKWLEERRRRECSRDSSSGEASETRLSSANRRAVVQKHAVPGVRQAKSNERIKGGAVRAPMDRLDSTTLYVRTNERTNDAGRIMLATEK